MNIQQHPSLVGKRVIEALHDLACAISAAINEFDDPADKAALRDGMQKVVDVAIVHDQRGSYGVFVGCDEDEVVP